ncbi:hypothetical protein [Dactylosporangium maewongense]|uniref:hypothetical protein n=1 Tax=Dactylosporangium maewongense TaxID=634393 RepID=UPI0031E0BCD7
MTNADAVSFSLAVPPLFAALAPARNVLIAGAGGGFDVYAGLPLALALWEGGTRVHLASLSFSQLELPVPRPRRAHDRPPPGDHPHPGLPRRGRHRPRPPRLPPLTPRG